MAICYGSPGTPMHSDCFSFGADTTRNAQEVGVGSEVVSLKKLSFFHRQPRIHTLSALVSKSCHNKAPHTRALKQQKLRLHSSGGRMSEIKGSSPGCVFSKPLVGLQVAVFSASSHALLLRHLCPHLRYLQGHQSDWMRDLLTALF